MTTMKAVSGKRLLLGAPNQTIPRGRGVIFAPARDQNSYGADYDHRRAISLGEVALSAHGVSFPC